MASPLLPPAPVRLSTTTGWPSFSVSRGTSRRTTASVLPPGGKVTTMRIGLLGQSVLAVCAWLVAAAPQALAAITSAVRKRAFMAIPEKKGLQG